MNQEQRMSQAKTKRATNKTTIAWGIHDFWVKPSNKETAQPIKHRQRTQNKHVVNTKRSQQPKKTAITPPPPPPTTTTKTKQTHSTTNTKQTTIQQFVQIIWAEVMDLRLLIIWKLGVWNSGIVFVLNAWLVVCLLLLVFPRVCWCALFFIGVTLSVDLNEPQKHGCLKRCVVC